MAATKKSKRKKVVIAWISVILFFAAIWLFLSHSVNPVIRKVSEQKVKEMAAVAVNNATQAVVVENATEYSKIIDIVQNQAGEIEMMSVNSYLVNLIARQVASYCQTNISRLGSEGVGVPLGSLSGVSFLSGRGPEIKIKVYPIGSVSTRFDSEFLTAGINQTKHRITLMVKTDISIIMPGMNRTIETQTPIALSESIIIGKVPEVYLNSNTLTEMLNLVP